MEPIQLDPMAVIQAQQQKIAALVNENVQLTAAVAQLQQQLQSQEEATYPLREVEGDDRPLGGGVMDVTDQMIGAEITS